MAPPFRGAGHRQGPVEELTEEARSSGRTLSIHVEMHNPARSLYDRLGFVPVGEHGVYVLMKWRDQGTGATVDEAPSGMDLA